MLLQPDFEKDPLSFIKSSKNRHLSRSLLSNGMRPEKIREIIQGFYSYRMVMKSLYLQASNPEWLEVRAWASRFIKNYEKAIGSLEVLLIDDSIPAGTRDLIQKDILTLRNKKEFIAFTISPQPVMKPIPVSCRQMLAFQSFALFMYLRHVINREAATDRHIFDFMAELFRNLYVDTALQNSMRKITGTDVKNWVDDAYKLSKKRYDELVRCAESIINN